MTDPVVLVAQVADPSQFCRSHLSPLDCHVTVAEVPVATIGLFIFVTVTAGGTVRLVVICPVYRKPLLRKQLSVYVYVVVALLGIRSVSMAEITCVSVLFAQIGVVTKAGERVILDVTMLPFGTLVGHD